MLGNVLCLLGYSYLFSEISLLKFNRYINRIIVFPSPNVRPFEIIIKIDLLPFNVFKTFQHFKVNQLVFCTI